MKLHTINSGSSGNGYVLYDEKEALIIECGCPYLSCMKALGFNRSIVSGAVVSHEHGDHAKYVEQYLATGIPVWTSGGTASSLSYKGSLRPHIAESGKVFSVGNFEILPFDTQHDCTEPFGYLIRHRALGVLLFATDTYYLKYRFSGLTEIMIECNFIPELIKANVADGVLPAFVKERVFKSHLSLDTCISTLLANDLTDVKHIVLLHLSSHNSDENEMKRRVESATGKLVRIAKKDTEIDFNLL